MSSNLLKQQFVYNEQSVTRIINSNQKMEEKMKELVRIYQMADNEAQTVAPDAQFVEGILAEEVSEEPKVDPDALIAEAQAEASRILEDARTRADQMLNEANAKALTMYEEQKTAGYEEGTALMEQELDRRKAQLDEQSKLLEQELKDDYCRKLEVMEADIVDAVIQVFDKVFHIQFEDKKEILLHLINDTLLSIESGKHFRIIVSEENWQFVDEHLEELREQLGSDATIEVARDSKMTKADCRIETDFGIYDCGVDLELDGLCRDIRSLCS